MDAIYIESVNPAIKKFTHLFFFQGISAFCMGTYFCGIQSISSRHGDLFSGEELISGKGSRKKLSKECIGSITVLTWIF